MVAPLGQLLAVLLQPIGLLVQRSPGSVRLPLQWQCSMCTLVLRLRLLRVRLLPLLSRFLHAKSHALRLQQCWRRPAPSLRRLQTPELREDQLLHPVEPNLVYLVLSSSSGGGGSCSNSSSSSSSSLLRLLRLLLRLLPACLPLEA